MELCTTHSVISPQHRCPKASFHLRSKLSPSLFQSSPCPVKSELRLRKLSLRAASEETQDAGVTLEDASPVERIAQVEVVEPEKQEEENAPDHRSASIELLDKLDVKLDTDSTIPVLLLGGGAIVSICLASAVVGAIDAIPVFPKLMQVVGITYTVWFTSRYLILKKSRDELSLKLADLKLKIMGSDRN